MWAELTCYSCPLEYESTASPRNADAASHDIDDSSLWPTTTDPVVGCSDTYQSTTSSFDTMPTYYPLVYQVESRATYQPTKCLVVRLAATYLTEFA